MPINETYGDYRIQIVLVEDLVKPRNKPTGPWLPEVRIFWKEGGKDKVERFRVDHSFKRERDAERAGIARGKLWIDEREAKKPKP
jgi:hypothetical protein